MRVKLAVGERDAACIGVYRPSSAEAAAFPASDIRLFIAPFTIGYLYWLLKCCQRFEYQFKLWVYPVTNYDLKVTK